MPLEDEVAACDWCGVDGVVLIQATELSKDGELEPRCLCLTCRQSLARVHQAVQREAKAILKARVARWWRGSPLRPKPSLWGRITQWARSRDL